MHTLSHIRQVFLDMDGTIYHGSELFPTTIPFLNFLEARGIGYAFLSNNSSYSTGDYIARLRHMGIRAGAENFYISTDYAIDYLKRRHPEWKRLWVLAMDSVKPAFSEAGFAVVEEAPDAVVVAFDRTLTYDKLCRAAWWLRQGVPGIATHPDVFCPTDRPTWLVDVGAVVKCLEAATNTVIKVLGKPDPGMLIEAARRRRVPIEAVLMVGDRLATDIALGRNAGAMTCRILSPGADLVEPKDVHPDLTVADLGELQAIWSGRP